MKEYAMLFFEELGSHGIWGLFLFMLSSFLAFIAGHLIRDCFSQLNNKYFDWSAIWLPIVVLLLSLLCGGFLLMSTVSGVPIVMIIWLIISVVIGTFISMDKNG